MADLAALIAGLVVLIPDRVGQEQLDDPLVHRRCAPGSPVRDGFVAGVALAEVAGIWSRPLHVGSSHKSRSFFSPIPYRRQVHRH